MKHLMLLVVLLSAGCDMSTSPTSPTPPPRAPEPTAPPVAPSGPPFTVSLTTTVSPVYPGMTSILVTVTRGSATEMPLSMRVACPGQTITRDMGFGSLPVSCDFPQPGSYTVQATVTGSAGFTASALLALSVIARPSVVIDVFYTVTNSDSTGNDVTFSTRAVDGASRYRWDFGDGTATVETLLPYTTPHRYEKVDEGKSNERVVTVTVIDASGRTLATGRVVGRW